MSEYTVFIDDLCEATHSMAISSTPLSNGSQQTKAPKDQINNLELFDLSAGKW